MVTFKRSDELREAEFAGTDLTGARFVEADLSGVVMRGIDVQGADRLGDAGVSRSWDWEAA
jgi:uncharacterized protein YjbI with pentapeptide repeats